MSSPTKLIIFGITGSVGQSALKVLRAKPADFELLAFSYHSNFEEAKAIAHEFGVQNICCSNQRAQKSEIQFWKDKASFFSEMTEVLDLEYDRVLISVVGAAGVYATHKAATQGKTILLANKESLVVAGQFIMQTARENKTTILPVDSEHNSVYRLMPAFSTGDQIVLTASGGPLKDKTPEQIYNASITEVLNHPTWNMGNKITVDSAGMINKALEIIEAHHLFDTECEKIEAVIHPQSIVHAMLRKNDGTYLMHSGFPDMIYPVAHSMYYPAEPANLLPEKNAADFPQLSFEAVPREKFPGFFLGRSAGDMGGAAPAIFNAANEIAVENFLSGKIKFGQIVEIIAQVLKLNPYLSTDLQLDDLFDADKWAREAAKEQLASL
ncbi:MAG: 1-deoxy-D-xylulose-5-phosphate reductoisomerase [Leptospiraceae bacterium]|nr:1-deoxy-D-xylulose-5-phosphate reductoisomerase [Leptospiraceae bacterium]